MRTLHQFRSINTGNICRVLIRKFILVYFELDAGPGSVPMVSQRKHRNTIDRAGVQDKKIEFGAPHAQGVAQGIYKHGVIPLLFLDKAKTQILPKGGLI